MPRCKSFQAVCRLCCSVVEGFFLDVPAVIDHAWRHTEYLLNAECDHCPGWTGDDTKARIDLRPFWKKPAFWFFAITVYFTSYGPSWDGLCTIAPQSVTILFRRLIAIAIIGVSLWLAVCVVAWRIRFLIKTRFDAVRRNANLNSMRRLPCRRVTCCLCIYSGFVVFTAAGIAGGVMLYGTAPGGVVCAQDEWNLLGILRLLMCIAAVVLFGWLMSGDRAPFQGARIKSAVVIQFLILLSVGLIQWFILSTASTRAASGLPYRHLFLVAAPSIAFVVALAPWWARYNFRSLSDETKDKKIKDHFHNSFPTKELFLQPVDPPLSGRAIVYAFAFGPAYHILHVLLFPALVAIAVPGDWLYPAVLLAFLFSVLLVVWGNMSPRWQQLNIYIARWFLSGIPLLISLFVMVIGILRLGGVDYVSTLLDAIPFGTVLSLVLMYYVLFWLAEYWMNRAVALELLRILGEVEKETYVSYPTNFGPHPPELHVDLQQRYLASHGTGRFIALGNVELAKQDRACRAFQSYGLTETFEQIDGDKTKVANIVARTGTYFVGLNIAMFAVAGGFLAYFVWQHRDVAIKPVVSESREAPAAEQLVDLSILLQEPPQAQSEPVHPAIVVIGSGGGTRAALYTESVLRGLHRMGVDRDIVLVSGVSGGGVALAYFAANKDELTGPHKASSSFCHVNEGPAHSVDDAAPDPANAVDNDPEWNCFADNVTKPFIEDVLNGATEWRIISNTSLSVLLAESFERYLFGKRPLGSIRTPAFILNSTIVSHPDAESAELTKTINAPQTCAEAEQTFKLLGGGRLIFTNLQDIDTFPRQEPGSTLPDVRLPYRIVRDPKIWIARAAALNANFPPVFPAARVHVPGDGPGECTYRSFFVTDGGAEENLGLISALYALEAALAKLKAKGARARPIHVVIAEASAIDFDYSQDRGVSAFLGGSSEQLAGGLTLELRNRVDTALKNVNGDQAAVEYHFLGLPLAFRARGGVGTHWLYAKSYWLSDPRARAALRYAAYTGHWGKVEINRASLERLWSALHNPDPNADFCNAVKFNDRNATTVQGWLCGSAPGSGTERDLHMAAWRTLVQQIYHKP
jgi:hypothetical protein